MNKGRLFEPDKENAKIYNDLFSEVYVKGYKYMLEGVVEFRRHIGNMFKRDIMYDALRFRRKVC